MPQGGTFFAIDAYPEATDDAAHFERAAHEGRVLESRPFSGIVWWPRKQYARMTEGDTVRFFEALAAQDEPFEYSIVFLKPKLQ